MDEYKVILTPKARQELKGIGLYIARDNPVRATSYVIELQQYLNKVLSVFPRAGRFYNRTHDKEVRSIPYQEYVSIYNIDDDKKRVNIVHVFNAAKDKDAILRAMVKRK